MQILYLLNGRSELIINANSLDADNTIIRKIDEKELTSFRHIINEVNQGGYSSLYFACIENSLQRFHFFMMLYILLSNAKSGGILDEGGHTIKFSRSRFFFYYLPSFVLEIIVSSFVVLYHYIKLPVEKWKLMKKS